MIISLTGFMGCGKTTVGKALAEELGWRFTDLDEYIAHKAGKSVERIFAENGETVFRALEAEAVRDRIVMSEIEGFDLVLSLGGGTLTINSVRPYILQHTTCVYLEASEVTLTERLRAGNPRPLLKDEGSIKGLLEARKPIYESAALTINTDGASIGDTVHIVKGSVFTNRL